MKTPIDQKHLPAAPRSLNRVYQMLTRVGGNTLLYILVLLVIFSVLGLTMVSLFTTSSTSSATPNDARRALYMAESGVRYAASRIKNARFQQNFIEEINNTSQYTLDNGSSFKINIFSPWFISPSLQDSSVNNIFTLSVPNDGKIPANFSIPDSNIILVNWNNFNGSLPSNPPPNDSYAQITASSATAENTSLTITVLGTDDLVVNVDDTVCLAVQPTDPDASSPLQAAEDIYIAAAAKDFFPPRNGAIRIVTADNQAGEYYYEELVDETTRVKLTNLAPLPGTSFAEITDFSINDWVVLSSYNYRIITTGTSGNVTSEIGLNKQVWLFPNSGQWTISEREFIEDAVLKVTDDGVIKTTLGGTPDDDEIQIGEDTDTDPGFGTIWYGGDKPIGGNNNFCQNGRCLFDKGIRVFFTLDYSGDGEGFVFALINGGDNTSSSAGGDAERSEMLGYAGDSRENASGAPFLDGSLNGDGLLPPKMGIEFDTRTNFNNEFEQTLNYCNGASLNSDTRNDPQPGGNDEDAVQYVFWGREAISTFPLIPCRDDDATYDDNKHDAEDIFEKWQFNTGSHVQSSPAIGTDGTVYFGSDNNRIYALNPADRLAGKPFPTANEWEYNTGASVKSSPAIGADGTIYIGSDSNKIYAFNPAERIAGSPFPSTGEWEFLTGGNVKSSPAIGSDGTVYVGSDDKKFYAINPDGSKKWEFSDSSFTAPPANALGAISEGRPAIGPTGNIYVSDRGRTLVALDPEDRAVGLGFPTANEWAYDLGDGNDFAPGVDPDTGIIYSDRSGNSLVALFPDLGSAKFVTTVNTDIDSTPAVGTDGTIYFGGDSGHLFALNPSGSLKWLFPNSGSIGAVRTSPAIGPNETIYFGSDDQKLYAVNPDVTSETDREKFSFDTGGLVKSSPAVDPRDETVYVGSDSNRLHAINQLAEPRNFRDNSVVLKKLVSSGYFPEITFADATDSNNWLQHGDGLWAVRMEVTYDGPDGPIDGNEQYQYTLKTWVEKCTEAGCSKFLSSLFRDTLINYKVPGRLPKLEQIIKLSPADHAKFERFLFGFTSAAAAGDTQEAIIRFFELSFIRLTDPDVTSDPNLDG